MNGRRSARRAAVIYVGLVIALSYRPGHPWAGLAGGAVAIVVLAMFLVIGRVLTQLADAKERADAERRERMKTELPSLRG
jgi:hypothetical protein